MRSASSKGGGTDRLDGRSILVLSVCLVAACVAATSLGARASGAPHEPLVVGSNRIGPADEATIGPAQQRILRAKAWQGGAYTTSTGEIVRVFVSDAYPDANAVGQRWADFFAGLVHGSELALMTAYVVTAPEMALLCGAHALGCYGGNQLGFIGETVDGVTADEVARTSTAITSRSTGSTRRGRRSTGGRSAGRPAPGSAPAFSRGPPTRATRRSTTARTPARRSPRSTAS